MKKLQLDLSLGVPICKCINMPCSGSGPWSVLPILTGSGSQEDTTYYLILFTRNAGNWTHDLLHARHVLSYWATASPQCVHLQGPGAFMQVQDPNTILIMSKIGLRWTHGIIQNLMQPKVWNRSCCFLFIFSGDRQEFHSYPLSSRQNCWQEVKNYVPAFSLKSSPSSVLESWTLRIYQCYVCLCFLDSSANILATVMRKIQQFVKLSFLS